MPPVAGNKGQGPLTLVVRGLDALTIAFNVIGTMLIVALMVLIGADVAGRGLFNAPISGVPELVTLSIVVIVFLQIPQTMRAGWLTRSDAILEAVRSRAPRAALAMEILFDLTAIAVVAIILHATWPLFLKSWERNTFVGAVGDFTAPVWPVKLVIMIGAAMLILQFARRAIANLARILGAIDNTPREETP